MEVVVEEIRYYHVRITIFLLYSIFMSRLCRVDTSFFIRRKMLYVHVSLMILCLLILLGSVFMSQYFDFE